MEANVYDPFFTLYKFWWWLVYTLMIFGAGALGVIVTDALIHAKIL